MDGEQLDPVAGMLIEAYFDTASYSRDFINIWGRPPTIAAKAHHLRSVAQTLFFRSDRYLLNQDYIEFGRVQFVDDTTGRTYLLRSASAVSIEQARDRLRLFDPNMFLRSDVAMVVYSFGSQALDLSIAGTRQRAQRRRLEASGPAVFIRSWPYVLGGGEPFDQRSTDPFSDVGDLDMDDDEDEASEVAE